MNSTQMINNDCFWVGANDRRINLFENIFPLTNGVSYNSYVIKDEKIAILDTVDQSCGRQFMENIEYVLEGKRPDYIIVNHMEPDHCAMLKDLVDKYQGVQVVANDKTVKLISQFFPSLSDVSYLTVKEGDTLSLGKHTLNFVMAPMVHWPEAMVTYDSYDKTLYSADAFGTFGALNGNIFCDEAHFDMSEARRYYSNIVGKYGPQVQALLNKASALEIETICPLHGPVWRKDLNVIIDKYQKWSSYQPEEKAVMIAYASMYGNTQSVANALASELAKNGVKKIVVYDISTTHFSYLVSECFRCSHIVIASPTYNNGIYPPTETFLHDLKALNVQNRTVGLIQNGSWAPAFTKLATEILSSMKDITILENNVTIKSAMYDKNEIENMAQEIAKSIEQ
ncbi:MAG: FprA family A-type flavoprotein [Clostridia bacterium]|nr:FprA family A-type flavoprotein [Clostridia bacterium]